jgi:hypothetical protein
MMTKSTTPPPSRVVRFDIRPISKKRPAPSVRHKTGLPQFDQASVNKGHSDNFRGLAWWPGPRIEPLSYAAGYQVSGVRNPRTRTRGETASEGGLLPLP